MVLDNEQVTKFQTLYKNRFGKEISREEAYAKGTALIRLVELVYKPPTEAEYQHSQEHRRKTDSVLKERPTP